MSNYDHDQDLYDDDDDKQFYEETAYNEQYYIDRELELIRQSNLEIELDELEERHFGVALPFTKIFTLRNHLKTEKPRDMLWLGICRKIIIRPLHAEITHV
jgi:hypothetical protein